MTNVRRNLAVQLIPVGGANPLKMRLVATGFVVGTAGTTGALIGQGGIPAYAYSIVSGSLPTGLSLNSSTGVISGTPSVAGTFTFTAQIQDSALTAFIATFSINVAHILRPTAYTPLDADWATGTQTYQFAVSGATGTLTYSITSPPAGISISSSGLFSFATFTPPNAFHAYSLNVNVSDSGTGDSISIPVAFNLYPYLSANWASFFSPINVPIGAESNFNLATSLAPTGGKPPYSWKILDNGAGGAVPSWITLSNSGVLDIAPPAASVSPNTTQNVRVQITDSLGLSISATFTCVAVSPNNVIQAQQSGSNVGSAGFSTKNYTGGAWNISNAAGVLTVNLPQANGSTSGYLLAADWTTFNNGVVTSGAQTWSGDKTFSGKVIPAYLRANGNQSFPGTAASGVAYWYNDVTLGLVMYGFGTTSDVDICNRNGSAAMQVIANTTTCSFPSQTIAPSYGSNGSNLGTITTSVAFNFATDQLNSFVFTSATNVASSTATLPAKPAEIFVKCTTAGVTSTMTWPTTFKGAWPTAGYTASKTSVFTGFFDGTNVVFTGGTQNAY